METIIGALICMVVIVMVFRQETKRGDTAENRLERYRHSNKVLRAENEKLRLELSKAEHRRQKS